MDHHDRQGEHAKQDDLFGTDGYAICLQLGMAGEMVTNRLLNVKATQI